MEYHGKKHGFSRYSTYNHQLGSHESQVDSLLSCTHPLLPPMALTNHFWKRQGIFIFGPHGQLISKVADLISATSVWYAKINTGQCYQIFFFVWDIQKSPIIFILVCELDLSTPLDSGLWWWIYQDRSPEQSDSNIYRTLQSMLILFSSCPSQMIYLHNLF